MEFDLVNDTWNLCTYVIELVESFPTVCLLLQSDTCALSYGISKIAGFVQRAWLSIGVGRWSDEFGKPMHYGIA